MDLLTSAEAAALLGVGPTAVKRWADEGQLPCVRTAGGHRRFERRAVQQFARGHVPDNGDPWGAWLTLLTGGDDLHRVVAALFEERAARGSWDAVAEGIGGLLRAMGERWHNGTLTVHDEHVASARLQQALDYICMAIPVRAGAPVCVLATTEGDAHTLGLSLVQLCAREAGWRPDWLGRDTRTTDLVERMTSVSCDLLCVSASAASVDAPTLERIAGVLADVCTTAGVDLALGGDGAWPDPPPYGRRYRDLASFSRDLALRH